MQHDSDQPRDNSRMMGKLLMAAILMFGFGFALVPFYEKICEVTGINILARKDKLDYSEAREFAKNTQVDTSRQITIEFDANVQGAMAFKPKTAYMTVHPGELQRSPMNWSMLAKPVSWARPFRVTHRATQRRTLKSLNVFVFSSRNSRVVSVVSFRWSL